MALLHLLYIIKDIPMQKQPSSTQKTTLSICLQKPLFLYLLLFAFLFGFFSVFSLPSKADEFGYLPISDFYGYDADAPLNATLQPQPDGPNYSLFRVDFDGVWGRRVPALFMVPAKHEKPCPAIIFGHGYTGNKRDAENAFEIVAGHGFCMLSIDMWYHGDRQVTGKKMYSEFLYQMREGLALSVVDLRRSVDFLQSRPEVDPDRISYVGGSMGGILGGLFAGVEPRVKAPVFIVAGGDWPYLLKNSIVGQVDLKLDYGQAQRLAHEAEVTLAPVDTLNTVQYISPRPMLMINAKHDILVNPFSNKEMFARAKPPKKIIWFDSDHGVPIKDAVNVMLAWYNEYLINGHAPTFESSVEGFMTTPIPIKEDMRLKPPISGISFNEYLRYDNRLPLLSTREEIPSPNPRVSKYKITYQSTHDRMVNGVINLPTKGSPPYPCVIFAHDLGGSLDDVDMVADVLARNGIASIAIGLYGFMSGETNVIVPDKQESGENIQEEKGEPAVNNTGAYKVRSVIVQSVQDVRRIADLVQKYQDIVSQTLTVFGVGTGGAIASIVAATDDRFKGTIIVDAADDPYSYIIKNANGINNGPTKTDSEIRNIMALVDPKEHIGHIQPRRVLMIYDESKLNERNQEKELYKRAGESKELRIIKAEKEGVSRRIGLKLKATVLFIRDILNGYAEEMQQKAPEKPVAKVETGENLIDRWKTGDSELENEGKCEIERAEKQIIEGKEENTIILKTRIRGCLHVGATIIANIETTKGGMKYIQLIDSGRGYDTKPDDGIFTADIKIKKNEEIKAITIGGIDGNGNAALEKTVE